MNFSEFYYFSGIKFPNLSAEFKFFYGFHFESNHSFIIDIEIRILDKFFDHIALRDVSLAVMRCANKF